MVVGHGVSCRCGSRKYSNGVMRRGPLQRRLKHSTEKSWWIAKSLTMTICMVLALREREAWPASVPVTVGCGDASLLKADKGRR